LAAYELTHSLSHMTGYAVAIGILSAAGGVLLSSAWDIPSGPAIVLVSTLGFFLSVWFSPKRLRGTAV